METMSGTEKVYSSIDSARKRKRKPEAKNGTSDLVEVGKTVSVADFPRGGAKSTLTPVEYKKVQKEVEEDILFQAAQTAKSKKVQAFAAPKKLKKRRTQGPTESQHHVEHVERTKIESLSYKRLGQGMIILGQISQVGFSDLGISLPNNLTGYVSLLDLSPQFTALASAQLEAEEDENSSSVSNDSETELAELSSLYRAGQWVRVCVKEVVSDKKTDNKGKSQKKHISLSMYPERVNKMEKGDMLLKHGMLMQASVVSLEDHGIIMDIGVEGVSGFIGSDQTELWIAPPIPGQVVLCCIAKVQHDTQTVLLTPDLSRNSSSPLKSVNDVTHLVAGTCANIQITSVRPEGVVGNVVDMVEASSVLFHKGRKEYHPGEKEKCRILFSEYSEDGLKVGISLLPHIVELKSIQVSNGSPLHAFPIGFTFQEARVIEVLPAVGVFLDVGVEQVWAFAHISRLADERIHGIDKDSGRFKVGSTHTARVIGFNFTDGYFQVSMEEKVLEKPFLRVDDISIGQAVDGTVIKVLDTGLLVSLTDEIVGFVPKIHQSLTSRSKINKSIKCRVLNVDVSRKRVILTTQKALLALKDDIITSIALVKPLQRSVGVLSAVKQNGAVVEFFGGVRGFLPVSEMSEAYIQDATVHFHQGHTVTVYIKEFNAEDEKIQLTCRNPVNWNTATNGNVLSVGSVIGGKIVDKTSESLIIYNEEHSLTGIISVGQISDESPEKSSRKLNSYRLQQFIKEAVILYYGQNSSLAHLSTKKSLLESAKQKTLPFKLEGVVIGAVLSGYISSVTDYGLFVSFGNRITGLVPKFLTQDKEPPSDLHSQFQRDETIMVKVLQIDNENQRIKLSSKTSDVLPNTQDMAKGDQKMQSKVRSTLFKSGDIVNVKIIAVKATQLNVELEDSTMGRVDVSMVYDIFEEIEDPRMPLKKFKAGQVVKAKIIGSHDVKHHRYLPITQSLAHSRIASELSLRPSHLQDNNAEIVCESLDTTAVGDTMTVFVNNNKSKDCVWVHATPNVNGRIMLFDLSDQVQLLQNIKTNFPLGSALKAEVVKMEQDSKRVDFSSLVMKNARVQTFDDIMTGSIVTGRISKLSTHGIIVQLASAVFGHVFLSDVRDSYIGEPLQDYITIGEIVRVCILSKDKNTRRIDLSMRPSRVLSSSLPQEDPEIQSLSDISTGQILRGFVKNVADAGLFVSLNRNIEARVRISDLFDGYVKDWKSKFYRNQLVRGKVKSIDFERSQLDMTLKLSMVEDSKDIAFGLQDVTIGTVYVATVKRITDYGVFVQLTGSNVSGLAHKSELSDLPISDLKSAFQEGDTVKVKVLKLDPMNKKLSFGMKASYFNDDLVDNSLEMSPFENVDQEMLEEDPPNGTSQFESFDLDVNLDGSVEQKILESGEPLAASELHEENIKPLDVGQFDWTGDISQFVSKDENSDDESVADAQDNKRKLRKRDVRIDKTASFDTAPPESEEDFERLILGSPNSSALWIKYMAFHVDLGRLDKARAIAKRAIKTINYREDDEKINIWLASLNLEASFGTEDSLFETLREASYYSNPKTIHLRLVDSLSQTPNHELVVKVFDKMLKDFAQSSKIWSIYASYLFKNEKLDAARELLPRSLKVLPTRKHVKTVAKFAHLEYDLGEPERGRTIMEGLLANYPKRLDLWSVLIDQEAKQDNFSAVRLIFQRVLTTKLSTKKAKFIFKKWLDFEKSHGSPAQVEQVKSRAVEFVSTK